MATRQSITNLTGAKLQQMSWQAKQDNEGPGTGNKSLLGRGCFPNIVHSPPNAVFQLVKNNMSYQYDQNKNGVRGFTMEAFQKLSIEANNLVVLKMNSKKL